MTYTIEAIHDYTNLWPYKISLNASYGVASVVFALSPKTIKELIDEYDVDINDVHIWTSKKRWPVEKLA